MNASRDRKMYLYSIATKYILVTQLCLTTYHFQQNIEVHNHHHVPERLGVFPVP